MDFIRKKLMLKTNRYKDKEYDLDLTYITPRIIAMSYPAKGFEQIYKNPRSKVSKFFLEKHSNSYQIINLSNRNYSKKQFNNKITNIKWEDHHPCIFQIFIKAINEACLHLLKKEQEIIAVHCNAGKGRTGSLINAILFVSGEFEGVLKANQFYLEKRGVCVTNPSQVRYMEYFERFWRGGRLRVRGMRIFKIVLRCRDRAFFFGEKFKFKFYDFLDMRVVSVFKKRVDVVLEDGEFFFVEFEVSDWKGGDCRDLFFRMKKKGVFGYKQVFRVNFNLFFCDDVFCIKRNGFDKIDKDVPEDFEILFHFEEEASNQEKNWNDDLNEQFKIAEDIKIQVKNWNEKNGKSFIFK